MTTVAQAPAKLVLFGEYAVLEGAPALVAAVNRRATVRLDTSSPAAIESDLGSEAGRAWLETWQDAADARVPTGHVALRTTELFTNGHEAKLGLGSSAALTVALGAAVRHAQGESIATEQAFAQDLQTHRRLQGGSGSGIDVAASFHGGVLAWWQEGRIEKLALPAGLRFTCVWTGRSASTADMLARVRDFKAAQPGAYGASMDRLRDLATQALDEFRAGCADALPALARSYHDAMADLGARSGAPIISEPHRDLARIAGGEDVCYKPSGAGGGDVGLLFSTSAEALRDAGEKCIAAGYRLVDLQIDELGVAVTNA